MVSFNAGPSWSSVVMSLKRMPFCGKSGTSLMRLARSITAPPGSPAGEFYRPERCAWGSPTPMGKPHPRPLPTAVERRATCNCRLAPLPIAMERGRGWGFLGFGPGFPGLQNPGDPEPDDGDQLVGVPATVAPSPQIAELLQRVVA